MIPLAILTFAAIALGFPLWLAAKNADRDEWDAEYAAEWDALVEVMRRRSLMRVVAS